MGAGAASVGMFNRTIPVPAPGPPGPPFLPTSADNGLSVDAVTGRIVLGDNTPGTAAALLSDRFILDNGAFVLWFKDAGTQQGGISSQGVGIVNTVNNVTTAIFVDGLQVDKDAAGWVASAGNAIDFQNSTTGFHIYQTYDTVNDAYVIKFPTIVNAKMLHLSATNRLYQIGDVGNAGNGTRAVINDAGKAITNRTDDVFSVVDTTGNFFLLTSKALNIFELGDISASSTGTLFAGVGLTASVTANQSFTYGNTTGKLFISAAPGANLYRFGDISGLLHSTFLSINDGTGVFDMLTAVAGGIATLNLNGTTIQDRAGSSLTRISPNTGSLQIFTAGSPATVAVFNGAGADGIFLDSNVFQIYRIGGAGAIEIKYGLKVTGDTTLIHTGTALANGAAAALGTLTNAPAAGNPTKWIPIDDNGTTRFMPAW